MAKARWASDRSLELAPESVFFRLFRAIQEFRWTGEVARTKKFLAEIPAGKDPDGRVTAAHCTAALYERNFPEALRLLAACPSERLPFLYGGFGPMVPKGFVEGMIHFYAGNKERAYTALDSARWILEMEAKENPGDEEAHQYLAMAYAAMGWKDAALAEIARDTDGLSKAWLFARAGERDAALRQLEQVPAKEREYWYYELRLHPHWDPLRSDARFEKMLAVFCTENRGRAREEHRDSAIRKPERRQGERLPRGWHARRRAYQSGPDQGPQGHSRLFGHELSRRGES